MQVEFRVRSTADGGGYYYDRLPVNGPRMKGYLETPHPPQVGDQIYLPSPRLAGDYPEGGQFVVVSRHWLHSSWQSMNWPSVEPYPMVGPMLVCVVERAEGVYVDERARPQTEEA